MSRPAKLGLAGLAVLALLALPGISPALASAAFALLFGWMRFAGDVLPKVRVNPSGVGMLLGCLVLAAVVGQRFCGWLWKASGRPDPWRWRWTLTGLVGIVILFAAGLAFTGVAHQAGWLLRSPEPLTRSSGGNERNSWSSLKTIASAQADFRSNDRDGNRIPDFWRADVAGLYALKPEGSEAMIKLIEVTLAGADAHPATPIETVTVRSPKAGYWYRALRFKDEKEPDPDRFAALAYPDSKAAGLWMFIISHEHTIYRKAYEGGPPPEVFPDDLVKEGWTKLD